MALPLAAAEPDVLKKPVRLTVMTYNIHHAEGLDGKLDLPRIAEVIAAQKADIVGLQEVDRGVKRSVEADQPRELAERLKMHYVFGKNIDHQGGDYGNAILSRFSIRQSKNTRYKVSLQGEQRGLLQAIVEIEGRQLLILNTHLDYHRDDTERLANVSELVEIAATYGPLPTILLGDFNATPHSPTYNALAQKFIDAWPLFHDSAGPTSPAANPRNRIDYIFLTREPPLAPKPLTISVIPSDASDHLAVVAEIELP
jgi:endonuclease/exonuclease/phosphatase family metal-dependent hydrolase